MGLLENVANREKAKQQQAIIDGLAAAQAREFAIQSAQVPAGAGLAQIPVKNQIPPAVKQFLRDTPKLRDIKWD